MIRPTVSGLVVAVFAGLSWYAGLLLDDRVLMAGAVTLTIVWVVSLLIVSMQRILLKRDMIPVPDDWLATESEELIARTPRRHRLRQSYSVASVAVPAIWLRVLLPSRIAMLRQFARLDQDGRCIGYVAGLLPRRRGWYQCVSIVVRWHDPFGLFTARRVFSDDGDATVLPESTDTASAVTRLADARLQGQSQTENAGGVREYRPGDPPKLISWKQTAHRGTLMTRETGRDVRSVTVVVFDTRNDLQESSQARSSSSGLHASTRSDTRVEPSAIDSTDSAVGTASIDNTDSTNGSSAHSADSHSADSSSGNAINTSQTAQVEHIPSDGSTDVITDGHVNAEVLEALPMLRQPTGGGERRIIVTDGVCEASDMPSILRLLAGAEALTGGKVVNNDGARTEEAPANSDAIHAQGEVTVPTLASTIPSSAAVSTAESRAAAVARIVGEQQGVVTVILLTPHPQGAFARALRTGMPSGALRVHQVDADQGSTRYTVNELGRQEETGQHAQSSSAHASSAHPRQSSSADSSSAHSVLDESAARAVSRSRSLSARQIPVSSTLTALCLLVFFALTLKALANIIAVGWWAWFAVGMLSIAAVAANIPSRTVRRETIRVVVFAAATLVTTVALILIRIHGITGYWLFHMPASRMVADPTGATVTNEAGQEVAAMVEQPMPSPWQMLENQFTRGFDTLIVQLPPIRVDANGDLLLIVVVAGVAIVVRCVLAWRRVAPALALLPLVACAASYALTGSQTSWWQVGTLVCAFLLSLWAIHTERSLPLLPLLSDAVITAMVLALTPAAVDLAYAVPLSIGESKGLLSANTINPMIDLKRSLEAGSDSIVMSYSSTERRYLRMATLDNFDGDTWNFDEKLAKDGGFYGSGIQLGRNDTSNDPSFSDGDFIPSSSTWRSYVTKMADNPLGAYMNILGLLPNGYNDYGAYDTSDDMFYALIRGKIGTLSSRFLPVAGIPMRVTGGVGGWIQYEDGTIYNRSETTVPDMQYGSTGIYIDPITSDSGFQRISSINAMRSLLIQNSKRSNEQWSKRTAGRRAFAQQGEGEIHGNWLMIPVRIGSDGTSLISTSGQIIGDAAESGIFITADGKKATSYDVSSFNETFKEQVALSDDDIYGVAVNGVGGITLILAVENPQTVYMGSDSNEDSGTNPSENSSADFGTTGRQYDYYDGTDGSIDRAIQDMVDVCRSLGLSDVGMSTQTVGSNNNFSYGAAEFTNTLMDAIESHEKTVHSRYRSLPDNLPKEVTDLVSEAQAAGVATDGDGYDHQVAAMRWLVQYFTASDSGFTYSLDAPDGNGRDNMSMISQFLRDKAGYCAHYASALAILGRAMGVPTRMVLGYNKGVGGTNKDDEYDVAARQLHSWVEAYIDGIGWVPFDVTPASSDNGSAVDTTANADADTSQSETQNNSETDNDATSNSADADTQATDNTEQQNTNADKDAAASTTQQGGMQKTQSAFTLPAWAWIVIWAMLGVLLLVIALLTPALIRRRRRRRRFSLVGGTDNKRAWYAAWLELCDTAWDNDVRWKPSDTERAIAANIVSACATPSTEKDVIVDSRTVNTVSGMPDAAITVVRRIADQVASISFGAAEVGDTTGLLEGLQEVCDALAQSYQSQYSAPRRWLRALFPPSLRRGRK